MNDVREICTTTCGLGGALKKTVMSSTLFAELRPVPGRLAETRVIQGGTED